MEHGSSSRRSWAEEMEAEELAASGLHPTSPRLDPDAAPFFTTSTSPAGLNPNAPPFLGSSPLRATGSACRCRTPTTTPTDLSRLRHRQRGRGKLCLWRLAAGGALAGVAGLETPRDSWRPHATINHHWTLPQHGS